MRHLEEENQHKLVKDLKDTDVIVWDIHDLESAHMQVIHSFELREHTPVHWKVLRMPLKHN